MLPSADLQSKCLACGATVAPADDTCRTCGADPALERQIYAQMTAAVREQRWVFLAVLAIDAVASWLVYDHLTRLGADASAIAISGAIVCGVMAGLWLLAPRAPVAAATIGTFIFGADWAREIARDHVFALDPGPALAFRVIIMSALGFAIQRGLAARKLRAQRRQPPPAIALSGA